MTTPNRYVAIDHLDDVLRGLVRIPTASMWNRLEGRPRAKNFTRAVQAEIADPLWMLTRQWQFGEFHGRRRGVTDHRDDCLAYRAGHGGTGCGWPWFASVRPERSAGRADRGANARPPQDLPLDERFALGVRFGKLLTAASLGGFLPQFHTRFAFVAPDPSLPADFAITAHAATYQLAVTLSSSDSAIDGGALLGAVVDAGRRRVDRHPDQPSGSRR